MWIGEYVFDGIYKLASITLPSSVTSIGAGAFAQDAPAHDLTQINYRGTADQYWTLCNTNAISATGNDNIRVSVLGANTTIDNVAIQYGVQ